MIKNLLHLKYLFEINLFTLSKKNILLIAIALFVIYFFMTQILMYDLYDLPKSKTNCVETPNGKVCELSDYSYETDEYKSRK
ncbi:MAG: hypothetical protein CL772_04815 [Chloroflexi bacterium]|nr:hypothetical protein [Chloroflexota bacterium]MBK90483.1 hypothetical protein [Chloroflexota bacterium]